MNAASIVGCTKAMGKAMQCLCGLQGRSPGQIFGAGDWGMKVGTDLIYVWDLVESQVWCTEGGLCTV